MSTEIEPVKSDFLYTTFDPGFAYSSKTSSSVTFWYTESDFNKNEWTLEAQLKWNGLNTPIDTICAYFFKIIEFNNLFEEYAIAPKLCSIDDLCIPVCYYLFTNKKTINKKFRHITKASIEEAYRDKTLNILFAELLLDCERVYNLSKKYPTEQ
jgi:hypothetical protein